MMIINFVDNGVDYRSRKYLDIPNQAYCRLSKTRRKGQNQSYITFRCTLVS